MRQIEAKFQQNPVNSSLRSAGFQKCFKLHSSAEEDLQNHGNRNVVFQFGEFRMIFQMRDQVLDHSGIGRDFFLRNSNVILKLPKLFEKWKRGVFCEEILNLFEWNLLCECKKSFFQRDIKQSAGLLFVLILIHLKP